MQDVLPMLDDPPLPVRALQVMHLGQLCTQLVYDRVVQIPGPGGCVEERRQETSVLVGPVGQRSMAWSEMGGLICDLMALYSHMRGERDRLRQELQSLRTSAPAQPPQASKPPLKKKQP